MKSDIQEIGSATAGRIIISLEKSTKNAETVIGLINNFVDTYYRKV